MKNNFKLDILNFGKVLNFYHKIISNKNIGVYKIVKKQFMAMTIYKIKINFIVLIAKMGINY